MYTTPTYTKGGIEKAEINLVDFAKTPLDLAKNQSSKLTLSFTPYDLASYDAYDKNGNGNAGYELEKGEYTLSLRTDSHTKADCEHNEIKFVLDKDLLISNDPVTNKPIENRFTGENAYWGLEIDALAIGGANYMTRANFAEIFPAKKASVPSGAIINQANTSYYNKPYESMPEVVTGKDNQLYLATLEDGTKATKKQLEGNLSADSNLMWNYELLAELSDYESEKWDDLLDQMSLNEMKNLIELGGFERIAVESVGKPRQYDYDGPAGFNTNTKTGSWGGEVIKTETWTAYPSEAPMGCSWNKDMMYELGRSMGAEADVTKIDGWYAPGVNLHHSHKRMGI